MASSRQAIRSVISISEQSKERRSALANFGGTNGSCWLQGKMRPPEGRKSLAGDGPSRGALRR